MLHREVQGEALTGETDGPAIEPRNQEFGMPMLLSEAEGNTEHGVIRQSCSDPARSETLCTSGSPLHRNWEISAVPGAQAPGGGGKAKSRNPAAYVAEKSDTSVVPEKPSNKGPSPAEIVEERDVAKGNTDTSPAPRTQSRISCASMGLEGVREAARRNKGMQFTALLHHITPQLLAQSFYALRRDAAVGVDGMSWREYEEGLLQRVTDLHARLHSGAYRATPSRRVYIPKADGRQRPLGIDSLEDKIVQQAVVTVLNAIYEEDFLGFSYGFRPGRSQHDALAALTVALKSQKVNWILDADITSFFDEIDHEWMLMFLGHRIADRRLLGLICKWLQAGVVEDGRRVAATKGTPQGAVISPLLANIYLHYVLDLWARQWRERHARGDVIVVRYADDSVVGFRTKVQAQQFLVQLQERLARFGLSLNALKTRLIEFGRFAVTNRRKRGLRKPETFDFLGFTHCCSVSRRGDFQVLRLTVKKRMRATLLAIREELSRRRHDLVRVQGQWLKRVVSGYFNYHAVPGNLIRLSGFRLAVCRLWRQALKRRSQRNRLQWSRYGRLADLYIPRPRNAHPYPEDRFASHTRGRSRMR